MPLLDHHDQPYTIHTTKGPKDAGKIGADIAYEPSPRRIIAAGGDGTTQELIEGIGPVRGQWEIIILPLGTVCTFQSRH